MTPKIIYTWQDILKHCQIIAKKITHSPDLIVAITKGGLPIATVLANQYLNDPPIITLQLKEIESEGKANYQAKEVKTISPLNNYPIEGKNVLIVDDIADSGSTLKKAIKIVKRHHPKSLTTTCLHYKPRTIVKPDIFAKKIDNHVWIVYPWE